MSEIRKDPVSHTWVVISTERGKRPSDYKRKELEKISQKGCPFCEGKEFTQPTQKFAIWPGEYDEKTKQWITRVLPNKFPALKASTQFYQGEVGELYHYLAGVGGHEVLVDSRDHFDTLANMKSEQVEAVLRTYIQRYKYWRVDPRIVYVLIFKNYRHEAGASLSHPHSQLIATPIIPPRIFEELREAKEYYKMENKCIFCQMVEVELKEGSRKVFENESIVAFCPYASRFPFEIYILPKNHQAILEELDEKSIFYLTEAIQEVFKRLEKLLNDPPYNYMLHVSPLRTLGLLYYHWHFEVIPRLAMPAGFEFGGGIFINPISPEDAAKALREVDLNSQERALKS